MGRLDPWVWALAAATVVVAVAGLTSFTMLVRPEVSPYLMMLRSMPVWLAVVGVVGFALVNPVWEEGLPRRSPGRAGSNAGVVAGCRRPSSAVRPV